MKVLRIVSRIVVGIVFIYSGFVKGIDLLGSTYKFSDYFDAFGISFLKPGALILAYILCTAEIVMGFAMLTRLRMRQFSWLVLIFMAVFTPLTLILAIYNPVSDCGCFGDALILTNWETFWKNVIISVFVLFVFFQRKKYSPVYGLATEWGIIGGMTLVFLLFFHYNLKHLPVIDYRPYKIGTYMPDAMQVPEGAPQDEYETTFYYKNKNTGKVKKFSEENYPWNDTATWEFVNYETKLVKKGVEPPIHDFDISKQDGEVMTDYILYDKNYSFLVFSHDLDEAELEAFEQINKYAAFAKEDSLFSFYFVTASTNSAIRRLKREVPVDFEFHLADEITIKTIVRSNPGVMLIKNGTIIGKWHYNDFPEVDVFNEHYLADLMDQYRAKKANVLSFFYITLLLLGIFVFRTVIEKICKE